MTPPLRAVAHGLRTVATGINLTCTPVVFGGVVAWFLSRGEVFLLVLGVSLIGVVVTAVGRCFCLRVPPAMPAARARIRLAVILDLTGLGSTAALVIAQLVAPTIPPVVVWSGVGFSAVALVAGRVMFFLFLHALAVSIRQPKQIAGVRFAARWSLLAAGCVGFSYGAVLSVAGQGRFAEVYFLYAFLIGTTSCLILGGIWWRVYTLALQRLSAAVESFTAEPATDRDSPDREYRSRYPADATEDEPT